MKVKDFIKLLDTATENTEISIENGEIVITEPKPKDITDSIKTFEDAVEWCKENKPSLYLNWKDYFDLGEGDEDIVAYLKLRIITTALNEGWEPTFEKGEYRWFVVYDTDEQDLDADFLCVYISHSPKMVFKSQDLARYAANQFSDLYADFCGFKKGGEQ